MSYVQELYQHWNHPKHTSIYTRAIKELYEVLVESATDKSKLPESGKFNFANVFNYLIVYLLISEIKHYETIMYKVYLNDSSKQIPIKNLEDLSEVEKELGNGEILHIFVSSASVKRKFTIEICIVPLINEYANTDVILTDYNAPVYSEYIVVHR